MDYSHIKKSLDSKEHELQQRLAAVNKDLQKAHSQDFAEQAVERENDEVLQALLAETQRELQQIHHALQRIDNGEYGNCLQCGSAISSQRLAALPEANTCIACASQH